MNQSQYATTVPSSEHQSAPVKPAASRSTPFSRRIGVMPSAGGAPILQAGASVLHQATGGQLSRANQPLLQMQAAYGNRYVQQVVAATQAATVPPVIQTKLVLGPTDDPYEREADRVAQQVAGQTAQSSSAAPPLTSSAIRRMSTQPGAAGGAVDAGVQQGIQSARGGGSSLPESVRSPMEQSLGADFSGVRIHTGARADQLNQSLQARAFTTGSDIFFRRGEYNPGKASGRQILAHELTHVVQQGGLGAQVHGTIQRVRYHQGERIPFTYQDQPYSGLVIDIRKNSKKHAQIEYEVDANMNGVQKSLIVKNNRVIRVEEAPMPDVDDDIRQILGMDVTHVTDEWLQSEKAEGRNPRGQAGDVLVGGGIVIKRPTVQAADTADVRHAKTSFTGDVLRDLAIIAGTESGKGLLTSIQSASASNNVAAYIAFLTGRGNTPSNAGQMAEEGLWDATLGQAEKGSSASIGYNPSISGLPLFDAPNLVGDAELMPALKHNFGRPKHKPADVTLFHELVHGDDILHGRLYTQEAPSGQFDKSKISEMHAVGLDEYYDANFIEGGAEKPQIYSENTYRTERGVALRPFYKDESEMLPPLEDAPRYQGDEAPGMHVPVPAPYTGIDKFFTRKGKINQRNQAITTATQHNQQVDLRNEQIKTARNRRLVWEEVMQSNAETMPKKKPQKKKKNKLIEM